MRECRLEFKADVPLADAEETLHLALFAAEGLFGRARVRLEVRYELDRASNTIVITSASEVGTTVARIFTSLALQEFGEGSVRLEDCADGSEPTPAAAIGAGGAQGAPRPGRRD